MAPTNILLWVPKQPCHAPRVGTSEGCRRKGKSVEIILPTAYCLLQESSLHPNCFRERNKPFCLHNSWSGSKSLYLESTYVNISNYFIFPCFHTLQSYKLGITLHQKALKSPLHGKVCIIYHDLEHFFIFKEILEVLMVTLIRF